MADAPITRPSLLIRIRDAQDAEAWQQFVGLYAPVIYGYLRKRGLQDADAADLTQDALRTVAVSAGRLDYDPQRGKFRGWLFTLVHRKLLDFLASKGRRLQGTGDTGVHLRLAEEPAPPADEESLWNEEYERQLLARAIDQVRDDFHEQTWQAFWLTAMEGKKAKEAAEQLGLSVTAVYMAKSRVTTELKKLVRRWQSE
ncbi:MAG TPA: sigma-70 family RNA polymerase sigma factor [Gemmataceae bacterium]|nr:sigma-70 family RNA polymerase sigma factor [Gemmataceae bacterium]